MNSESSPALLEQPVLEQQAEDGSLSVWTGSGISDFFHDFLCDN